MLHLASLQTQLLQAWVLQAQLLSVFQVVQVIFLSLGLILQVAVDLLLVMDRQLYPLTMSLLIILKLHLLLVRYKLQLKEVLV